MVWEIPYTFTAGTKAKANEVNGNFTSIKQFVDQLESNLATAELKLIKRILMVVKMKCFK